MAVTPVYRQIKGFGAPFGYALTFLSLTIQVLLPILVGLEIANADRLGIDTATICSAVIGGTPHGGDSRIPTHRDLDHACPLCSALAIAQAFAAPDGVGFAPRALSAPVIFAVATDLSRAARHRAAYRSRAPPSLI